MWQDRFYLGRDRELAKLQTLALTEEELELKKTVGMVDEVIGRAMKGGALQYELKKTGFSRKEETTWETIDLIKSNSRLYPPYVMKLVRRRLSPPRSPSFVPPSLQRTHMTPRTPL